MMSGDAQARGPRTILLIGCVILSGCVGSKTTPCSWGRVCPTGMICDEQHERCVFPSQTEACKHVDAGGGCSYPGTEDGVCVDGVCFPDGCGDGNLDPAEVCDDGNREDGDGCNHDCRSLEQCGNTVIDYISGENCDDGNTQPGDGCGPTCLVEVCGNAIDDDADDAVDCADPDCAWHPDCP